MMANKFQIGEYVFVPRSRLGLSVDAPSAFLGAEVVTISKRSIQVKLPDGLWSDEIGTSACHRNIGVLLFRIGDFNTETGLLEPLAKSVIQYFRLLLNDEMVRICRIRSLHELSHYWGQLHGAFSHVVLIGHGRPNAIQFGVDGWVESSRVIDLMQLPNPTPKTFLSLCCQTGYASFSKEFSRAKFCNAIIAPFHSVHGAIASQFCQTFFTQHLLDGLTFKVAFKHAQLTVSGGKHFRFWKNGQVTGQ